MPRRVGLESLLRAHRPLDAAEDQHRARMLELLGTHGDPFARTHFEPGHFTASGFVLSPDGGALLLIHHRKLLRWVQPGGHIETGDADVEAGARRELREEVGLDRLELATPGIFDLDVHSIPAFGTEPAHEHFDVRFLFRAAQREFAGGEDVETARFLPFADIDAITADRSVVRAVEKLRGRIA
jgi:8-oxo-dGTP pyrophosphatase MutT (NUDIX family)